MAIALDTQVRAAQTVIPFLGPLYRSRNGTPTHAYLPYCHLSGTRFDDTRFRAMLSAEAPAVVDDVGMVVFDVHRLPEGVDVYINDDGEVVVYPAGTSPHGLTLWHDLFAMLRGPELRAMVGSLMDDGVRYLSMLDGEVMPDVLKVLRTTLETKNSQALGFLLRQAETNFFKPAEDHLQKLQAVLQKKSPHSARIKAYSAFCDYFLRELIREPWTALRAVVKAAEAGDVTTLTCALHYWTPHERSVTDILWSVISDLWPLMARRAVPVVIANSVSPVRLAARVSVEKFRRYLYHVMSCAIRAVDCRHPTRHITIAYDPTPGHLCLQGTPPRAPVILEAPRGSRFVIEKFLSQ